MGGPAEHYAEGNKPARERQVPQDLTQVWDPKQRHTQNMPQSPRMLQDLSPVPGARGKGQASEPRRPEQLLQSGGNKGFRSLGSGTGDRDPYVSFFFCISQNETE